MKYISALILSLISILAPIQAALITVLALILVDLVTGVLAAYKRNEPITSSGLRRTLTKLFVYEIALVFSYIAQHYLIGDSIPVMKLISSMVGLVELKSVLENLNSISGTDLLKAVIEKLGSDNKE